ncbi:hypothetical protein LJC45_04910 [Alistipes sp. OttesenSCG-928-B03]|nr:hypothetical protein [Alistipes sp. OttesenSCG-928-B03]
MRTIKPLMKEYRIRFDAWLIQAAKGCPSKGRKKAVPLTAPNYLSEVILPVLNALIRKMPDHCIEIPDPKTYEIWNDIYPIVIHKRTIGGLTFPEFGSQELHFIPLRRRKIVEGEKVRVTSIKQLEKIIRNELAIQNGRIPIEIVDTTDEE